MRTPTAPTAIAGRGGTSRSRVPSPFGTVPSGYKLSAQVPPMPAAAEKKALSFEAGAPASQWTAAFHLAFPVRDVEESRAFYGRSLLPIHSFRIHSFARSIIFSLKAFDFHLERISPEFHPSHLSTLSKEPLLEKNHFIFLLPNFLHVFFS